MTLAGLVRIVGATAAPCKTVLMLSWATSAHSATAAATSRDVEQAGSGGPTRYKEVGVNDLALIHNRHLAGSRKLNGDIVELGIHHLGHRKKIKADLVPAKVDIDRRRVDGVDNPADR